MAGSIRISVLDSDVLQAVIVALKALPSTMQKYIRTETRAQALPIWQEELRGYAETRLEVRVLSDTGRVNVSNQNVTLTSASSVAKLRGGGSPALLARAVEFGADREATNRVRVGRRGAFATRHTQRQFRPVNRKGYVFYPAVAKSVPRIAALWAQTTARAVWDAFEGKTDG